MDIVAIVSVFLGLAAQGAMWMLARRMLTAMGVQVTDQVGETVEAEIRRQDDRIEKRIERSSARQTADPDATLEDTFQAGFDQNGIIGMPYKRR